MLIGSISDAIGRRKPLLAGLGLYVLASIGIVFVTSVEALTALRFVQGLGASAGMVLSMAIVRDRFEGIQVGKALARLMLVVGVAPSIAPLIGAQFLRLGSWRYMFVALALFGVVLLVLAFFLLKESLPVQLRRSGGVMAAARSYGSLLRDPMFMGLALLSGFSMAALFTYVSSATFVFQEGFGLSAQQFAVIFASGAVAITAGTQINGAMIGRVAPEQILRGGVLAALAITGSMVVVTLLGLGLWPLIVLLVSNMLVTGVLLPAVPMIALEANAHRAGSAAALLGAFQFGVGALIAPVTGLFQEGSAVAMASVMFGASLVTVAITLAIRPAMRRTSTASGAGPLRTRGRRRTRQRIVLVQAGHRTTNSRCSASLRSAVIDARSTPGLDRLPTESRCSRDLNRTAPRCGSGPAPGCRPGRPTTNRRRPPRRARFASGTAGSRWWLPR